MQHKSLFFTPIAKAMYDFKAKLKAVIVRSLPKQTKKEVNTDNSNYTNIITVIMIAVNGSLQL